ncbi:hypothetical protein [Chitinophaga japonensis]|uniref:Uncharacterized protein UPF0093 n=1 Tax=Chitinophaga japonensis TaxID=104662 RepID=A0A562SSG4_CHIJA|nr:hypothetical protein [Chitinophaga japonensis]TWI84073.1 uncharacterized protein UPF0093 [Chitinophaga japonensis]
MAFKVNPAGARLLKAVHIFCTTLWIGGLLTFLPLVYNMPLTDTAATRITYLNMRSIAWNVIGWGGITSFVTGLLNSLLTSWGLFRHTWIRVKLVSVIGMILFGMFYSEQRMLDNISILESRPQQALTDPVFLHNHQALMYVVPLQLLGFFLIVLISVIKPWMQQGRAVRKAVPA